MFALFRTWHNDRATDPDGPWRCLTLAIAYATEAHLFIQNLNQSPFNVGTRLTLDDFNLEQTADLNRRHGSPVPEGEKLRQLQALTGGHPYLTRRVLHDLVHEHLDLETFTAKAAHDDGPFGDHLRRMLVLLARDAGLCEAVQSILQGRGCAEYAHFYRLRSAGVIRGDAKEEAQMRCRIYADYLQRRL